MAAFLTYLKTLFESRPCPSKPYDRNQSDGCTLWIDGQWRPCCVDHDEGYYNGGGRTQRLQSDTELLICVARTGHPYMALIMFMGVRLFAGPVWPHRLRWGKGLSYCDSFTYGLSTKNGIQK